MAPGQTGQRAGLAAGAGRDPRVAAEALCADGNVAHSFAARCMLVSFTMTTARCSVRIMTTFTQLAPRASDPPEPFTDRLRLAVAAYLARFKGSSREYTESDLRCYLAWCSERSLDPLDAGNPPVQALHGLPAVLSRGRFLPDLRSRWHPGALTRRACPPSRGPCRITHARVHPPAVRGATHRGPGIGEPVRLRAGGHARPAGPADLRGHQRGHRRPRRRARPPGPTRVRQGH